MKIGIRKTIESELPPREEIVHPKKRERERDFWFSCTVCDSKSLVFREKRLSLQKRNLACNFGHCRILAPLWQFWMTRSLKHLTCLAVIHWKGYFWIKRVNIAVKWVMLLLNPKFENEHFSLDIRLWKHHGRHCNFHLSSKFGNRIFKLL